MTAYLELADYLLIAEAVLGVPAELIADRVSPQLAPAARLCRRRGVNDRLLGAQDLDPVEHRLREVAV